MASQRTRTVVLICLLAATFGLAQRLCAEQPSAVQPRAHPATRPSVPQSATYTNPIGVDVADPDVIKAADGRYYLYGTSAVDGYRVWSSDDLVHWTAHERLAFRRTDTSWGREHFWAPDVQEYHGAYYLYYSCEIG